MYVDEWDATYNPELLDADWQEMEELLKAKDQLRILLELDELADRDPDKFFDAWMELRAKLRKKIKYLEGKRRESR